MRYIYSLYQKAMEIMNRHQAGTKIYMFHQVSDDCKTWDNIGCSISTDAFEKFIDSLESKGYRFVSIDHMLSVQDVKDIVVTFDDVYEDAVTNAFPILIRKGVPFSAFITSNYIDREKYIKAEQLEQLIKEPLCTIGFHTNTHKMMRSLKECDLKYELDCSALSEKIKRKIKFFAFPYGSVYACTRKSIRCVKKQGYTVAFSTLRIQCSRRVMKKYRFFIPRINVCEGNYMEILRGL